MPWCHTSYILTLCTDFIRIYRISWGWSRQAPKESRLRYLLKFVYSFGNLRYLWVAKWKLLTKSDFQWIQWCGDCWGKTEDNIEYRKNMLWLLAEQSGQLVFNIFWPNIDIIFQDYSCRIYILINKYWTLCLLSYVLWL